MTMMLMAATSGPASSSGANSTRVSLSMNKGGGKLTRRDITD